MDSDQGLVNTSLSFENATFFNEEVEQEGSIEWPKLFKFYTDGIIGLIVAALGIIINALAMIMLARQRVQVTFHSLMIFLAIWDLLYLVISVLFFAMPVLSSSYYQDFFIPLVPFGLPIGQIFLTGSIYSTMALTIERYIAVCAPFFRLRNRIKASYYILPILLFAPLYNIPRFFELESTKETRYFCEEEANETDVLRGITKVIVELDENQYDNLMNGNSSMLVFNCTNSTKNTLTATDFRKDPLYVKIYMNYLGFLVTQLGPMLVLITLNVMIYRALKRNITPNTNSDNGTIRRNVGRSASTDALRKRDIRLTRISIIIVTIFIICHFPRIIPNVAEMAEVNLAKYHSFTVIISINQLLLTVNSTVNYIIYFFLCGRSRPQGGSVELPSNHSKWQHSIFKRKRSCGFDSSIVVKPDGAVIKLTCDHNRPKARLASASNISELQSPGLRKAGSNHSVSEKFELCVISTVAVHCKIKPRHESAGGSFRSLV